MNANTCNVHCARRAALPVAVALVQLVCLPTHADDEVSAAVLVRVDTDNTQVVTPRASGEFYFFDESTRVNIGYTADIWSSASIDMRTAATKRITEQRDELNFGASYAFSKATLSASYRLSAEPDYLSNGGSVTVEVPMAQKNSTLQLQVGVAANSVGRAGDNFFQRRMTTVNGRIAFTQLLGPQTLLQGAYEVIQASGFQSSPYRFVGVGGDGFCKGTAQYCLPETHPDKRFRNAIALRARRAIGARMSSALDYRFYIDSWKVASHTVFAQWNWLVGDWTTWSLSYRFYGQSGAYFYKQTYGDINGLRYLSRDRELSRMFTHRLATSYERVFEGTEPLPPLHLTVSAGNTLLSYPEFSGLRRVYAFDLVVAMAVEL